MVSTTKDIIQKGSSRDRKKPDPLAPNEIPYRYLITIAVLKSGDDQPEDIQNLLNVLEKNILSQRAYTATTSTARVSNIVRK